MKRFFSISALCAAMFCLVLTGCGKKIFTVNFDSQGGNTIASVTVEKGQKVTKPTDPTKDNAIFIGWYKEVTCQNAWNFESDVVDMDITLYAKWETIPYPAQNYSFEPKQATTLNLTGEATKTLQSGVYVVKINDTDYQATLHLYPKGSVIEGTYQFSFSKAAGTCLSSAGGEGSTDFPSFVITRVNGNFDKSYYLISGTVTVTSTNITVKAKSYYGSTININATWFVEPDYEFEGRYWGDHWSLGVHDFDFDLCTYGLLDNQGNWTGKDGDKIYIDFSSETAVNYAPQAGNYTYISGDQPGVAGTFVVPEYSYYLNGTFYEPTISSGTLKISASSIQISLNCNPGGTRTILYNGPINWVKKVNAPAKNR